MCIQHHTCTQNITHVHKTSQMCFTYIHALHITHTSHASHTPHTTPHTPPINTPHHSIHTQLSSASSMPLERVSSNYPGSHQGDAGPSSGPPVAGSTPGEIVAVTAAACNTVWVGCDNGLVDQYSSYGRLLNTVCCGGVTVICTHSGVCGYV